MTSAAPDPRQALHGLLGQIYDAAIERERWPETLRAIGRETGLVMLGIGWGSRHPHLLMRGHEVVDCSPDWMQAFDERYSQVLSEALAHLGPPPGALRTHEIAPTTRLENWEFYADWMSPQGVTDGVTAQLVASDELLVGIGGYREPRSPPIRERESETLELLAPHVARAVVLADRLGHLAQERDLLRVALDQLLSGVVVLDAKGWVVGANLAAERLAAERDGLHLSGEGLAASDRGAQHALQRLVQAATRAAFGEGGGAGGVLAVPRASGRRPYELWVCPLPASSARLGGGAGAAVVLLADPEERAEPPEALLQRLHGLTPAEARLAARLAMGEALADAADALGVARETARNQLKQVFAKTDTHRQAELVALLLRGALGLTPVGRERRERERRER